MYDTICDMSSMLLLILPVFVVIFINRKADKKAPSYCEKDKLCQHNLILIMNDQKQYEAVLYSNHLKQSITDVVRIANIINGCSENREKYFELKTADRVVRIPQNDIHTIELRNSIRNQLVKKV